MESGRYEASELEMLVNRKKNSQSGNGIDFADKFITGEGAITPKTNNFASVIGENAFILPPAVGVGHPHLRTLRLHPSAAAEAG